MSENVSKKVGCRQIVELGNCGFKRLIWWYFGFLG